MGGEALPLIFRKLERGEHGLRWMLLERITGTRLTEGVTPIEGIRGWVKTEVTFGLAPRQKRHQKPIPVPLSHRAASGPEPLKTEHNAALHDSGQAMRSTHQGFPVARPHIHPAIRLTYNSRMTHHQHHRRLGQNLRDQPTWAEALRSLLLTQDLLDLPGRFDRFVDAQREANEAQRETNRLTGQRLNAIEGQIGNLEGGQYERTVRTRALARSRFTLGFTRLLRCPESGRPDRSPAEPRHRPGHPDRTGPVSQDGCADLIISALDNRHAVVEVSLTADRDDIDRAKTRAGILAAITGGTVTPVVITSRLNPTQSAQAEAAGVAAFVIPYP